MKESKLTISNQKTRVDLPTLEDVLAQAQATPGVKTPPRNVVYVPDQGLLALGKLGDTAFNGERAITRAGLPQIVPHGHTVAEVLENFFYPSQPPTATLTASDPVREIGASPATTLSYAVYTASYDLAAIVVDGTPFDRHMTQGSLNTATPPSFNKTFTMTVTDITGLSGTASASVTYLPARFYGPSPLNVPGMVAALTNGAPIDYAGLNLHKELAGDYLINTTSDCTGGRYIHLLYPAAYGTPSLVRSGINNFSAYTLTDVTITDAFGVARAYKLLTTGIQFGGAVNIAIVS